MLKFLYVFFPPILMLSFLVSPSLSTVVTVSPCQFPPPHTLETETAMEGRLALESNPNHTASVCCTHAPLNARMQQTFTSALHNIFLLVSSLSHAACCAFTCQITTQGRFKNRSELSESKTSDKLTRLPAGLKRVTLNPPFMFSAIQLPSGDSELTWWGVVSLFFF